MLLSRIAPVGALLLLSTFVGCALSTAPDENVTSNEESLASETFTLYPDAPHDVSSLCDIRTMLTLSAGRASDVRDPGAGSAVLHAHVYDEVVGACKVHVDTTPRDYAIMLASVECGSRVYSASETIDARPWSITVTDNRTRVCKDLVPARIVVEEREEGAVGRTLYSHDATRTAPRS